MSDAYDNVIGGKLRLKSAFQDSLKDAKRALLLKGNPIRGKLYSGISVSRKRKLETVSTEMFSADAEDLAFALATNAEFVDNTAPAPKRSAIAAEKTEAQRKFEEIHRQRLLEQARKEALKSHSDRIQDLNKQLEKMPEHHDLFKISYAGHG